MKYAAQRDQELHQGIADNLNQLEHNETPQTVNPEDRSALKKIGESIADATGKVVHIAGMDQLVRGEAANIGLKESKPWYQRLMQRVQAKMPLKKAA